MITQGFETHQSFNNNYDSEMRKNNLSSNSKAKTQTDTFQGKNSCTYKPKYVHTYGSQSKTDTQPTVMLKNMYTVQEILNQCKCRPFVEASPLILMFYSYAKCVC